MANGISWQATMHAAGAAHALDACAAGDEKPLHAHSASGSGELRWLEPGPRPGGSDFAERTLGVRYSYDFSNIAAVRYELLHTLFF